MSVPQEGWGRRAVRPAIGWGGVLLVAACLIFLILLAIPILRAVNRWADGQPVDLMGFAAVIGAAVPALGAIWDFVRKYMGDRHIERRDQIARGTAPERPFDSSTLGPSPDGPRPGDSP